MTGTQQQSISDQCKRKSVGFHPHVHIIYVNNPSVDALSLKDGSADERQQWTKPRDFLFSLISLTVGLGNIYRFPYAVYRNGGGAFLIPYLIMLTFVGRPIYFLELALGQFTSSGQVKVWSLAPILKGVGYGSMIGSITVCTYYASAIAVFLLYFFTSFQTTLPWAVCNPDWVKPGDMKGYYLDNRTYGIELGCNETDPSKAFELVSGDVSEISLAQLYFENEIMKQKDHMRGGIGMPDWKLVLCLVLAWFLIWRSLLGGVKTSGKVAYFTAIFPYFLLSILFIRAITLPNALEGILYLLTPDWNQMFRAKVWFAALSQCLFSLSTGFGPIITLGSYNGFDRNIYRDTWIITAIDTFTSLFAGITIFAVLGNLAWTLDVPIPKVTLTENDFAIIVFAQAVTTFEAVPQLFSIIFFLMLAVIGVGTATAYVGAITAVISDGFPKVTRYTSTTVVCFIGLLFGLIYVTPVGSMMTRLADYYGAKIIVCVMALVEVVGVAWIYGIDNFVKDIEFMLKIKLGWYWKFCWCYFIPASLTGILIYALVGGSHAPKYKGQNFSGMAVSVGWIYSFIAISAIPICAYHALKAVKVKGFQEKFNEATKPSEEWGPRTEDLRREWNDFKKQ